MTIYRVQFSDRSVLIAAPSVLDAAARAARRVDRLVTDVVLAELASVPFTKQTVGGEACPDHR